MDFLEAALDYARKGWPVFPCHPGRKEPLTRSGVLDATTNEATIRQWWATWPDANVAMDVGGAGMMALDVDPGGDLPRLAANLGVSLETGLKAKTPRGGEHWFYRIEDGEVIPPSASKVAPHVDVRSHHSYVLLAPSVTDAGGYSWVGSGEPRHRPPALAEACRAAKSNKSKDRDEWSITPDLPENVERAAQWLQTEAEVAIEGQGGDHCAYATAAALRSLGISPETSLDMMLDFWNPRCQPPWGEDAADYFTIKIENANDYATSAPGNMTPAYHKRLLADTQTLFKPVEIKLATPRGDGTFDGVFRMTVDEGITSITDPPWLIKGLLPQGAYALLIGQPGTYKTFIALDIARSVASGLPLPGSLWAVNEPGPVLFAVGEGRNPMRKRVEAWDRAKEVAWPLPFVLADPVPRAGNPEHISAFIKEALERHPGGYKLVVLDTVGRSMAGLNENAQAEASLFSHLVSRLQSELGYDDDHPATVLAIHHQGKDAGRGARGSSVFFADCDTCLAVAKDEDLKVVLTNPKQKDAEEAAPVGLRMTKVAQSLVPGLDTLAPAEHRNEQVAQMFRDGAAAKVLDEAIGQVLASNPARALSTSVLSEMLVHRPDIDVSSQWLRKRWLREARETKGSIAHRCYDPSTGRWRWKS